MTVRVLLVALVLTGCHPSSNVARCDRQLDVQQEQIAGMGGWLRCDPSYDSDEPSTATHVMQWNRFLPDGTRQPYWWLWDRRLDDYQLALLAWVGVYETRAWRDGRVPAFYLDVQHWGVPADVEADAYRWAATQL